MASDTQHNTKNQRFLLIVIFKYFYFFVQISFALLGNDKILVLKFPSKVHVTKLLVILVENIEIIKHLNTNFIVSALKIAPQNIIGSPRPFIFKFVSFFNLQ